MNKVVLVLLLSVCTGAIAAGGKVRGDDPFENPGDNPCFDEGGQWICNDRPIMKCDQLVMLDDEVYCVPNAPDDQDSED